MSEPASDELVEQIALDETVRDALYRYASTSPRYHDDVRLVLAAVLSSLPIREQTDSYHADAGTPAQVEKVTRPLEQTQMTIFWHPTGPLVHYTKGVLHIEDLNPEVKTKWVMTRAEMLRFGWRSILAAVRP